MPKIYTPKQIIKKLNKLRFVQDRQSGSHKVFYNQETGRRAVVPYHIKELPKGTISAILRESGISKEDFEKA